MAKGKHDKTEPILELKGVSACYGKIRVLYGIDLLVYPGELVCLLGGNASGKSTTLKTMLGIVRLDGSWGVHNPTYTQQLLERAIKMINRAAAEAESEG